MTKPSPDLHQVEPLTEEQIARFKRDGLLVLPGVLDADLCRRARDQMWEIIGEHRPAMRRDDPATWVSFSEEEKASYPRGGDRGRSVLLRQQTTGTTSATASRSCCWTWPPAPCGASPSSCWARARWCGRPALTRPARPLAPAC